MARPRKESPEAMRSRILDAARHVLVQKGYQDFRISEVAQTAGLASGTLYLYFKDKVALYGGVFMDLLDQLDTRVANILEHQKGLKALKEMAHDGLSFIEHYRDFLFQFTGEHPALSESKVGLALQARFVKHLKLLGKVIRQAVKDGHLRPCNPEFAAIYFSFLFRMFMIDKIIHKRTWHLNNKTDEFIQLFLNGLGRRRSA